MSHSITLQPAEAYQAYGVMSQKGFVIQSEQLISKQSMSTITKILGVWRELEIAQENMDERKPKFERYVACYPKEQWEGIQEYQYYKRAKERLETAQTSYKQTMAAYSVTSITPF